MNPRGPIPHAQAELDDLVFDLDCSADAQVDNTTDMLEVFCSIFSDGRVDDGDEPYVRSLLTRTKVEHRMNTEQCDGMQDVRRMVGPVFELLASLRGQLQQSRQHSVKG